MTMPKKGSRKITVNDVEYTYKITSKKHHWYDYVLYTKLVIELDVENNRYYTEKRDGLWEITPEVVKEIILREINEK